MCKHLLNAQVSIRYYNGNWYDCPLCYFEEIGEYPEMHRMGSEYVPLVSLFHLFPAFSRLPCVCCL